MSNPIQSLADIYNETNRQIDEECGTAFLFKDTFDKINNYFNSINYHLTDIEYLDGYFFFGMGSNSVIHFHIKECPNWKFAIWWTLKEKEESYSEKCKELVGDFFCMHERYLDKFKPTRAEFVCKINFSLNQNMTLSSTTNSIDKYDLMEPINIVNFIHKHPYLAYAKDIHCINYNYEKQRPIHSFFEYYLDGFNKAKEKIVQNLFFHIEYKYIIKLMKYYFPNNPWLLHDCGDGWSPRFDPIVFMSKQEADETGVELKNCYSIFLDNQEERNKYNKWKKKYEKIAHILNCYITTTVGTSIDILNIDNIEEYKEKYFKNEEIQNYGTVREFKIEA